MCLYRPEPFEITRFNGFHLQITNDTHLKRIQFTSVSKSRREREIRLRYCMIIISVVIVSCCFSRSAREYKIKTPSPLDTLISVVVGIEQEFND